MATLTAPDFSIHEFLLEESGKDLLRFSTAGSVDDGKSTLIGRLLYDTQSVYDDQVRSIQGKGLAVKEFLRDHTDKKSLPFYFGDDYSDESGFAAVGRGASVHVGKPRPTKARYRLKTPANVAKALGRIEAVLNQIVNAGARNGNARQAAAERR